MSKKKRWIIATMVALPLFGVAILARYVDQFGRRDDAKVNLKADALIVLGARVLAGGIASNTLRERTRHAVELQQRGVANFLICTGGVGVNPPSEGEVAAQLAMKCGVP